MRKNLFEMPILGNSYRFEYNDTYVKKYLLNYNSSTFADFVFTGFEYKQFKLFSNKLCFIFFDKDKPIFLSIFNEYNMNLNNKITIEPIIIAALPEYRGNDFTFNLYEYLLKSYNLISSGIQMNMHVLSVWSRLKLLHNYKHIGYNTQKEITGEIYGKHPEFEDKRIVLY
jgi:hypothetical protein